MNKALWAVPALALLGTASVVGIIVVSSGGEEEVVLQPATPSVTSASSTPTTTPGASVTPAPSSTTPQPSLTSIPCPTGDCSRISMFMEGPSEAKPGETVVYKLSYEVRNVAGTGVIISYPNSISYVSSRVLSGMGQIVGEPGRDGQLRWALEKGLGVVEVTFQVPPGAAAGSFNVGAYEPGTETTQSNSVVTVIAP